jgi:hypothetical protein
VRLMKGLLALRLKPDWKVVELEPTGATQMELDDIEIGKKYRCDYKGAQYFATVVGKDDKGVWVTLGDIINQDGDPGDPTEALGTLGKIQVAAGHLHPRERNRPPVCCLPPTSTRAAPTRHRRSA